LQVALNPGIECAGIKSSRLRIVDFFESRRDSRFHGTLAQHFCAKRVDRSYVGFFQPGERIFKIAALGRTGRSSSGLIEFDAKAQSKLTSRFPCECHGDEAIDCRSSGTQDADNPADQLGSLSRARGGFDD
jgi:hypothetical protein